MLVMKKDIFGHIRFKIYEKPRTNLTKLTAKISAIIMMLMGLNYIADAQTSIISKNEPELRLAEIDSNTIKLRNRLYSNVDAGDLNIYGFEENDVPIYADSVIKYRLSLLESEIPLDLNDEVIPFINLYSVRKRALVSKVLTLSKFYFPIFEEIFDREKIPMEMKYLAVIESALNQNAVSRVGATGLWQFMAPTGKMYGLKVNPTLDERREIIRSTEAAVKYFKDSYRIYGDWLLVIASYNCGPGNVNKAINRSGGLRNFWQIMPYLPRETRSYVPAFIAATYVFNYASEHNIYPADIAVSRNLDTVMVDNRFSLSQLSKALDLPVEDIILLNPSLRRGYIPFSNEKIVLTLPYQYAVKFAQLDYSSYVEEDRHLIAAVEESRVYAKKHGNSSKRITYTVKRGDLLGNIARKHNVSVAEIMNWNRKINKSHKIMPGQKLLIFPNRT